MLLQCIFSCPFQQRDFISAAQPVAACTLLVAVWELSLVSAGKRRSILSTVLIGGKAVSPIGAAEVLGGFWEVLRGFWEGFWRYWEVLRGFWEGFWRFWVVFGRLWAVFGRFWEVLSYLLDLTWHVEAHVINHVWLPMPKTSSLPFHQAVLL